MKVATNEASTFPFLLLTTNAPIANEFAQWIEIEEREESGEVEKISFSVDGKNFHVVVHKEIWKKSLMRNALQDADENKKVEDPAAFVCDDLDAAIANAKTTLLSLLDSANTVVNSLTISVEDDRINRAKRRLELLEQEQEEVTRKVQRRLTGDLWLDAISVVPPNTTVIPSQQWNFVDETAASVKTLSSPPRTKKYWKWSKPKGAQ